MALLAGGLAKVRNGEKLDELLPKIESLEKIVDIDAIYLLTKFDNP